MLQASLTFVMEFSDTLFFFGSEKSTDVDPLLWLCCLFVVAVVGALQLRVGELMGLVDAELVGESPVSLLLLLSVVPTDGRPIIMGHKQKSILIVTDNWQY